MKVMYPNEDLLAIAVSVPRTTKLFVTITLCRLSRNYFKTILISTHNSLHFRTVLLARAPYFRAPKAEKPFLLLVFSTHTPTCSNLEIIVYSSEGLRFAMQRELAGQGKIIFPDGFNLFELQHVFGKYLRAVLCSTRTSTLIVYDVISPYETNPPADHFSKLSSTSCYVQNNSSEVGSLHTHTVPKNLSVVPPSSFHTPPRNEGKMFVIGTVFGLGVLSSAGTNEPPDT